MNIIKRITAGVLSALTMVSSFPAVSAAPAIEQLEDGTFKFPIMRTEEDNQASEAEIKIGDEYTISDRGSQQATFLQNGNTRNIWPMHSRLSDNTEFAVYCGDHTKGNPGGGMTFTVTEKVEDMRLYGVVTKSDARNTLAAFVGSADAIEQGAKEILSNPEFDDWCYFCASQAAVWAALGDVNIAGGNWDSFSWSSSESLGYHSGAGKSLSANGIKSSLTLYAATLMLKQGNMFNEIWEPNGKNHAPWIGGTFSYSKGKTEFDPAAKESGSLNLPGGIADSGIFTLDTIDGQECYVLPMAATSATFVRGERIFVVLKDAPTGAFLIDSNGVKSTAEGNLTLHKAVRNNDLADNGNGQTWGETFKFCIPKSTVEAMAATGETLKASLAASMAVDRYNVYIAEPDSSSVQPGILVEPAVQAILIKQEFSSQPDTTKKYSRLEVLKTDEDKAPLAGAKIQIKYTDPETNKLEVREDTTGTNGKVIFMQLPINTDITVTELEAPPGYEKILEPKTVNSGNGEGEPVTCTIENAKIGTVGLKIIKKDADDATKSLQGAKFEVKYTDAGTPKTLIGVTDANGTATFSGLPLGAQVTITETDPPPGYKLMNPNPVTKTLPTTPGDTGLVEYTFTDKPDTVGLKIIKKDADDATKPLQGTKFEVKYTAADGTPKTLTGVTDTSGSLSFTGLPLGAEVTIKETDPPENYELMSPNPVTKTLPTTPGATGMAEYTFTDKENKPGELKIRKVDADTGANLAGASFKLEQIDGSFTTSVGPTNASGVVTIDGENLPNGSYKVTEINAPDGYVLNPEAQTFQWNNEEGQEVTITFKDYKKGALEILKYDAVTNKKLAGAAFDLMKDGKKIDSLITDETGRASKSGLAEGFYQLVEVNPPAGYLKDAKVYEVYIDPEDTAEVVRKINIPNYTKLAIRVIKVDNGTSVPLKGFTFELYKGASLITSGTTDDNGEIIFTDLEPGDYRVREAGGTEDYAVDAPDQFVTLVKDESEISTLTFRNDKKRDYRIKKIDADTGKAIPGVVFEIFRDGQSLGQLPPTDANGEVQLEHTEFGTYNVKEVTVPPEYVKSDETFIMEIDKDSQNPFVFTIPNKHKKKLTLKKIDEETGEPMSGVTFDIYLDNNKIDSKTTTNGEIVIENAEPGTYRFEEIRTLTGYELLRDPINIEMTADKDVVVTAKNHKRHDLIIYKRDATTHALLDGVTFEIFRDEQSLGDFITKNGGKIVIENAEPGTYKAVEKSTLKEYILNETTTVIEHTIDKDTTIYIDNTHRPGLGIDKRDSVTNQPLANVQFRITYSPGQTLSTDGGNVKTLGDFFTDANGKINLSTETGYNLEEGWYSVTEVKAPAGYIIKEPATQTVHLADGEYKELTFFNQPKSALVIWKYDARTHEALPGAKFEVRKLEGTGTGGVAIPGSPFTTGTNGSVTVTDLEPGAYIVQEISYISKQGIWYA